MPDDAPAVKTRLYRYAMWLPSREYPRGFLVGLPDARFDAEIVEDVKRLGPPYRVWKGEWSFPK